MSVAEIKKHVRIRDGLKCSDCGINAESYRKLCGCELDVHRLIPGARYRAEICITLCSGCHKLRHKKMSRTRIKGEGPRLRFQLKCTPAEKNRWLAMADSKGLSISEFACMVANEYVSRPD